MSWIVIGEENGRIKLVSKNPKENEKPGLLPKGSYLTVVTDDPNTKFILRVDESQQYEPYKPSPLVVDMDLGGLIQDSKCQNIIHAYRIKDLNSRSDGKIDFIHPQLLARRSTQGEINQAFETSELGPKVFLATIHAGQNQLLVDDELNFITTKLPEEMFFHQMLICGKTGSGKTVAMKYLMQYFAEKMQGAVLAINVKDIDLLQMNLPSSINSPTIEKEWNSLHEKPHGVETSVIYYPANTKLPDIINKSSAQRQRITLRVNDIEPESLTGLLQNISDAGAQLLPDIFRFWKERRSKGKETFGKFIEFFIEGLETHIYPTLNIRGEESQIPLHKGTCDNIVRNLNSALEFFDNEGAESLNYEDILYPGKLSVINVCGEKGIQFGSILLRHLLKRIVEAKSNKLSDVPILVIIDEVHQFYDTESSKEALGVLDTICRTGRSQKIGVIFSSQNQDDIPHGLSNVINTKIIFRSDSIKGSLFSVSNEEIQLLKVGYAVVNIHNLPQLKIIKFPVSFAGVISQ